MYHTIKIFHPLRFLSIIFLCSIGGSLHATESNEEEKEKKKEYKILLDRARGLCLGAAIGDSIGSYCEFARSVTKRKLKEAMKMPGGGPFEIKRYSKDEVRGPGTVVSGQVTDDTEMAISLARGLCNMEGDTFELQKIADEYSKWANSGPFDIGNTTKSTISIVKPTLKKMKKMAADINAMNKEKYGNGTLANGALMRCMPLLVYGMHLDNDSLYELMKKDAELTHANEYIYLSNTCYAIMCIFFLKNPEDKDRHTKAYNEMKQWLYKVGTTGNPEQTIAAEEIQRWLQDVEGKKAMESAASEFQGLVKIAFQRACYHLRQRTKYHKAIESVVGEGGDTDTNACIVGGLLGAYYGLNKIKDNPENKVNYLDKIENCKLQRRKKFRDPFQAKYYIKDELIEKILEKAPITISHKIYSDLRKGKPISQSNGELKKKKNQLAIENEELQKEVQNLQKENKILKEAEQESNSQIKADTDEVNNVLTQKNNALQKEKEELQKEVQNLQKENKILKEAEQQLNSQIKADTDEANNVLTQKSNALQKEKEELQKEVHNLQKENKILKEAEQQLNSQINANADEDNNELIEDNKPLGKETEDFATLQKANKRLQTTQSYLIISLICTAMVSTGLGVKLFKTKDPKSYRNPW